MLFPWARNMKTSKPQSQNSVFCSHILNVIGRHALYHQIKVMNFWAWGCFVVSEISQTKAWKTSRRVWVVVQCKTPKWGTNPKTQKHITKNHVGGRAVTGNAMAVRIWLLVLVTHILALWWWTVPPFFVRSQHACSPPSFTATAVPHAVPTNTKEHCSLLRNQVLWMILANSFMSHSRLPVFLAPREKKLFESDTWSRDGAILASFKIPLAPPGFDVWELITCSTASRFNAWFALCGAGGRWSATLALRLNPGIRNR